MRPTTDVAAFGETAGGKAVRRVVLAADDLSLALLTHGVAALDCGFGSYS